MTVAERQFGANLKLGATFGSAKFEHVLFYRASKENPRAYSGRGREATRPFAFWV